MLNNIQNQMVRIMLWVLVSGLFFACTSEDPTSRPSAKTILEILDSHEIWHASTDNWSQLGGQRGTLPKTISVDGSDNEDTEDESNGSDSVIELSSDEENVGSNEESDDSSDIEILEEIPFTPGQKLKEMENGEKTTSESIIQEPEIIDNGPSSTKEQKNSSPSQVSEEGDQLTKNSPDENKVEDKTETKDTKDLTNEQEPKEAPDSVTS